MRLRTAHELLKTRFSLNDFGKKCSVFKDIYKKFEKISKI